MEERKKTTNRKLTMSYDHPVDERFPLVTLTLPQLYKLRANCTLDTGVTWHASAEKLTYKQLYTQGMRLAKGLLALGLCRGDTVLSVGVDGSESALLFIAATMIGLRFAAPYICQPLSSNIGYLICHLKPKLVMIGHTLTGYDLEDPYPTVLHCLSEAGNEDPSFTFPHVYRENGAEHTKPSGTLDHRLEKVDDMEKLMSIGETISEETLEASMSEVTPNEPCFYTMSSGSSGDPKTIVVGAALFVNGGSRRAERWKFGSESRIGITSMCTEDIGFIDELTSGFYTTEEILVIPAARNWDCDIACKEILTAVEQHRTELLYADQYLLTYMVNHPSILKDFDASCLQAIMISGSGSSPKFKQSVVNVFPNSIDVYGLSEHYCTLFPELGAMKDNLLTTGRITVNQEVKVVDEEGNTVPINTKGELWIRGYGLFLEYKDQPELTQSVMTADGWFKTGDCVIMHEDSQIQVIGRIHASERFKFNSDVIYAQPIEKVMRMCPKILDIVVVGRATGTTMGDEIVYCIILKEKDSMTIQDVYDFAENSVQNSNEWPIRVFFYNEFPRHGARNKTSRKALTKDVEEMVTKDVGINLVDDCYLQQYT